MPKVINSEEFAKQKERENATVAIFHNIDSEDFTHKYNGNEWTIKAGEKMALQFPIATHFAKHLARKMIRRSLIAKGKLKPGDFKEKEIQNMYSPGDMDTLTSRILPKKIEQEGEEPLTEAEQEKQKTEQLQEQYKEELKTDAPKKPEVTKKDVIAELKKRSIKFNARQTKEELLQILLDSEKNQ